jgi:hypothetical protein
MVDGGHSGTSRHGPLYAEEEAHRISGLAAGGRRSSWLATVAGVVVVGVAIVVIVVIGSSESPASRTGRWRLPSVALRHELVGGLNATARALPALSSRRADPQAGEAVAKLAVVLEALRSSVPDTRCGRAAAAALPALARAAAEWGAGDPLGPAVHSEGARLELVYASCTASPRPGTAGAFAKGFPSTLLGP